MIPFAPIEPVKTINVVAERLEARIFDGTFPPGARLPSEAQLAQQLHVGRRTVREALKILETKGLVEVRMGVGAIVKRNDLDSFLKVLTHNINSYLSISKADIIQIIELRWILERAALQRLISAPEQTQVQRLAEMVEAQEQARLAADAEAYQEAHFRFHHAIIDALQNPVISMIYRQALALMRGPMGYAGRDPEIMRQAIEDHRKIVAALATRSVEDMEAVLERHLADAIDHHSASRPETEATAQMSAALAEREVLKT